MNFTLALMGLSIYLLLWEKLPDWGNWFNTIIKHLPKPLAYLYEAWRCPFCFGFWASLLLHWLTGITTLSALEPMFVLGTESAAVTQDLIACAIAWFLDAIATATLIMLAQLCLNALAVPAIKGYQMTMAFRQSFKETL
jgi:hypothetical protein